MKHISLHKGQFGYADAIDRDGTCLLHLVPGTERNVCNAQNFVDQHNAALDAFESARGALRRIAGMECAMMYDSRTCRLDWSPDDSTNWCAPCIARAELDRA